MERDMTHFSHEHPLILKAEERKIDDGTMHQSVEIIECDGCSEPISGPFYTCGECGYFLHKVCAELPNEMNHPMHPQHPLTLLSKPRSSYSRCRCDICNRTCHCFIYHCSICKFDVDMTCTSVSHAIEDKYHEHPLIPLQLPISFPCHICRTEEKGFSYKCIMCPFWVHQNCTVSIPSSVKHSYHDHNLTLLKSVPPEFVSVSSKCDICHDRLSIFHCVYYCERCIFFAHVSCARSEEAPQLQRPRDQNIESNQDLDQPDGPRLALLPAEQQKTMDLISWFAENYSDRDPITNLILGFDESFIDRDTYINEEIKGFGHKLFLIDDQVSEEKCDACALPISIPCYGCIDCGYFLHKCCSELPKHILHPAHRQHQISLHLCDTIFLCVCCDPWSNGFGYKCLQCNFIICIRCASLLRPVKHEAHPQHSLIPRFTSSSTCSACNWPHPSNCILQCNTCSFNLCFVCAMAPSTMKHRWDKHPFKLTYSPPENHYNEYICDLCEGDLNPKYWYYHCGLCDQFNHTRCMLWRGADLNIKYGKRYKCKVHDHRLTLVSCTYNSSFCNKCRRSMEKGYSVGLECIPCDFRIHLQCALGIN